MLARLRLAPEEEETFVSQLGEIVDYIDQLRNFSAAPPDPASSRGPGEADDRVATSLPREDFLANAPAVLDTFLLVPQVKGSDDE